MNVPHDFDSEQLMDLLDIATNALEEIAEGNRGAKTVANEALEEIAHKIMALMESQ